MSAPGLFGGGRRQVALPPAIAILLLIFCLSVIAALALHVGRQLERLEVSASEAVLWSLTQAELESSRLEASALKARDAEQPSLADLRKRFDVFYSRMAIIQQNENYDELRETPESRAALEAVDTFFNTWVPIIDGPDDTLRAALPDLILAAAEMRRNTRVLSLDGITRHAVRSAAHRNSIATTLTRIAWLTAILIGVLIGLLVILFRLARLRENQSRRNQAMRRRLETIIATSLDAIIVTDTDGRVVEFNGAAEDIFGYTRQEAMGAPFSQLIIPPEDRDAQDQAWRGYLAEQPRERRRDFVAGIEAIRKNGERFPVETSIATATTPEGERVVGFLRDISNRKAAETELRKARDRAIAGERSKARLLAVMSHEMRTPLNGILGTLDLMGTRGLSQSQSRYIDIIRNSARILLDQVNDVLDLSRLDSGKMQTDKRRFDLIALTREVIDSQLGAAAAGGNTLRLAPPDPALHDVWSDPDRLRQILLNLLSNAIKFTHNGHITLELDCASGLDEVEIRVIDSGIGIADEDLDRIFGDFVTLDASYQRRNKGTGLGLGIARRLARALGGELGAESEPGDGSVFWLRLPLALPADLPAVETAAEPVDKYAAPDGPHLSALIVEDNAVNRLILRRMLEQDGHRVTEATDGAEGIRAAQTERFDVIFMDISMPGMDGITATRRIRASGAANHDTRIVATTAHALPEEQQAFAEAGMTGVLLKPLTRQALRRVLLEVGDADSMARDGARDPCRDARPPLLDPEHLQTLKETLSQDERSDRLRRFIDEIETFLGPGNQPRDGAALAREAHRLAGSAGVFGAPRLTCCLQRIDAAAETADEAERDTLMATARTCWSDTRQALAEACSIPLPAHRAAE
ncbi:ATP-binding protein [Primorskyibacter sp. 2E107]|uniref:hybrid sensor histidine kinase/response regulator n=1 Tax=Primorskyibacter sp. 2E107 TaxID=3403458 RepID=UPI003AF517A3